MLILKNAGFDSKVGMKMDIETKRMADGVGILLLGGNLNTEQLDSFKAAISELLSEGFDKLIIDCRDLGVISSSGLAALLWARSSASDAGSHIYLTHLSSTVVNVLEVTKLTKLLRIEPTTKHLLEQLGAIRKPAPRKRAQPNIEYK